MRLSWSDESKTKEEWNCEVGAERLSWGDESKTKEEWKRWKYWSYIENTKEQFDLEELIGLITKPHMLTVPDEIDMAVDSKGKLWIIYKANDGAIYLARANDTLDDWVYHERLLYVPSGSTYPTIVFDNNDRHVIAAEFLPAGSEQKEIWIYEPPYSGDGIRRIVDGQYPMLAKDVHGERFLFYQAVDGDQVLYRKSSEAFAVEHDFETSDNELFPRGFRIHHIEVSPYHDIYKHLMFYQADGEELPRYKMSSPTDFYTVGLDLYITDSQGQGISGAIVEVEGQSGITNKEGLVTFYKLPYNISLEIKLSHPLMGMGDTQHIFIPESAKGTHVTHALFFTKLKIKENLGVQTGLTGIEWVGTIFEHAHLVEKLSPHINLRVEWESMLIPAYMLVYSGNIYEPVHVLTYTNPTTTSKRESLVWESKGQISNQDVYVNIYTDGVKRPGIALRCTGSSGRENLYAGYYRHALGELEIAKYVNGTYTYLASQSMVIQQGKWYSLRMQAEGSFIRLKIWDVEEPEPSNWALQTTDTSISNGYAGLWDYDGSGISKWSNFSLNGEEANWETFDGSMPDGWSLQFGTASRWTAEIESFEVWDIEAVPGATVQLGDQISQTNQEGLASFYDLQGGSVQSYEITHPDYPEISTGTVLIPEGEFDFIPLKIYEKPWDGHALEEVKVHVDLDVNLVAIDIEYRQPKESASISAGLTNILWVEVTE